MDLSPTTKRDVARVCQYLPASSYLRQFVIYALRASDVPLAFALGTGLSHLAAIASPQLAFRLPTATHPNLFILLAGSSGSRKTTAMILGNEILKAVAPERLGDMPGSWEGLTESLQGQPSQLQQHYELGSFLARSNPAATGGGYYTAVRQVYTDLYDCQDWSRRKAKGKRVTIRDPRLSLIGASTPTYLEQHTAHEDWDGGFMGRFLCLYAERDRTDFETFPWPEQASWLTQKLASLYAMGDKSSYPYMGRTTAAQALWVEWSGTVEERRGKANPWSASSLSRLPVNVLKIATLLALDYGDAGSGNPWHIGVEHLEPAIELIELHYQSVLSILDALASTGYERNRRNVLRTLAYETAQPIGHVLSMTQPKLDLFTAERTIATLVAAGEIGRQDGVLGTEPRYIRKHIAIDTGGREASPNVIPFPSPPSPPPVVVDIGSSDGEDEFNRHAPWD